MNRKRRPTGIAGRSAFSLVELLVVIGIIAVLMGLLLPSLAKAREQAKAVKCSAQLRSLGQALVMYTNNNRAWFPTWSGWHVIGGTGTGDDAPGAGWTELLQKYYSKPEATVYNCPSFPEDFRINYFIAARYSFAAGRFAMKFGEIKKSSEYILGGDCTQRSLYPPSFGDAPKASDDCDKDDATQEAVLFAGTPGGLNIHKTGNNLLFADGHVELARRFEPTRMTYHPRKMQTWSAVTID